MSLLVEKLETLDKNNVLAIRKEIVALKNKLKECEASKGEYFPVTPPPPAPGKQAKFLLHKPGPIMSLEWGEEGIVIVEGYYFCSSKLNLSCFKSPCPK